jgi:hypothetical protein
MTMLDNEKPNEPNQVVEVKSSITNQKLNLLCRSFFNRLLAVNISFWKPMDYKLAVPGVENILATEVIYIYCRDAQIWSLGDLVVPLFKVLPVKI